MQKTLQGLNTAGMDPELQLALKDMKSNLTPISDQVIKAHLADVVERSHGQIRNITVKKSLGAASVGQALLCTITTAQGNTKECVIKILRPDVQNRAQREKEIFIAASKQVPGMEMTFAGQLKRITEELDLTKEAENIKHGQVYTKAGFTKVKSMLLNPLVDTTPNVMVLERAPGNTVDSMIEQLGQRILDIKSEFAQKDENGNVIFNEAGDVVYRSDLSQEDLVKLQDKLLAVYDEYKQCQEQLLQLSNMWVTQGLYAESGFYHGDLHAGNIMFDKDAGTTIIDFGNATKLDSKQQIDVTKMAISASVADPSLFLKAYRNLLTNEGKAKFDELQADGHRVKKVVEEVFNIDNKMENTGLRIAVVLQELQKIGLELPAPIFNFSQCQMRLQNTVDTMNTALEQIRRDITNVSLGSGVYSPEGYLIQKEKEIVEIVKPRRTGAIEDKKEKVKIRNLISDEIKKAIDSYKHDIQDPAHLSLIFHHLLIPGTPGIKDADRLLDRLESQSIGDSLTETPNNNGLAAIKNRLLRKAANFMDNARTLIDRNSNSGFGEKEVLQALMYKFGGLEDDEIMRHIGLKVDANADEAASGEAAATPQAVRAFEEAKALLTSMFEDYKEYVELFTKMAVGSVTSGAAHTYDVVKACSAHDDTFYDAMADVVNANYHSSLHRIGLLNALRYWRRV